MEEKLIGILCAMDVELEKLKENLTEREDVMIYDATFHQGKLNGKSVVLVRSGIGMVSAARIAQLMIDQFHPTILINSGVAGALNEELNIGDVVIGRELVQHDFNATPIGYAYGNLCDSTHRDSPTIFTASAEDLEKMVQAATIVAHNRKILAGRIASGDLFVASAKHKQSIKKNVAADCAEMEGCALALAAQRSGVPFLVLRVMSDNANGQSVDDFPAFEKETADMSAEITLKFIELY